MHIFSVMTIFSDDDDDDDEDDADDDHPGSRPQAGVTVQSREA